jgi:hypothetical protein
MLNDLRDLVLSAEAAIEEQTPSVPSGKFWGVKAPLKI